MKPDWKDAPKWANWLAMDGDGEWFWYENEPYIRRGNIWYAKGRTEVVSTFSWAEETKEKRPQQ